ncbi:hypothetical protein [Nitrososphaera sp.]|uniref:hypothetical protein n=1 Tax=Nitrososphaera sp. TaxID=1971748 RepID=UPI00307E8745
MSGNDKKSIGFVSAEIDIRIAKNNTHKGTGLDIEKESSGGVAGGAAPDDQ